MTAPWLPATRQEMINLGWTSVDIVLITGDAYVDHPAFGAAVIGRVLESQGYRVGIIAAPNSQDPQSIAVFGEPALFFGITSGNIDSMLSKYTAFLKIRNDDSFLPENYPFQKPTRAVITYCNLVRKKFKHTPLVIGGIEASMRRLPHYDFWSNHVRRSILLDAKAAILAYGMAEKSIKEIAKRIANKQDLSAIPGTVTVSSTYPKDSLLLPAEQEILENKESFANFYRLFLTHPEKTMALPTANRFLIHTPPAAANGEELDKIFQLPYTRLPHPMYRQPIPAFAMIKDSIQSHRGCLSGCAFCSLGLHQGKAIISRSPHSLLDEAKRVSEQPGFKGHITDIGGPSANMYGAVCKSNWQCSKPSCLFPQKCTQLVLHTDLWLNVLHAASKVKKVNLVTIGSGFRYDLLMSEPDNRSYLKTIIRHHISGQLKIAPEHTCYNVLKAMRKTPLTDLAEFVSVFTQLTGQLKQKRYLLPYLMSAHPATTFGDMKKMKQTIAYLFHFIPNQVQTFIPLPMTLASVIFYTGKDPLTRETIYIPRDKEERRKQHSVFFDK
jgi:uncharacterized radical SAM protein YgiQ